jgi:hypothetical protein
VIQWVYDDSSGALYSNLVQGTEESSVVTVAPGFGHWDGRPLIVFAEPGGAAISTAVTYISSLLDIKTTAPLGPFYYVKADGSTDTDNHPNWVYDQS